MAEHGDAETPFEVVFDHLHARGRGDMGAVAERLHPDIVQQGVEPHLVCNGREQVLQQIRMNSAGAHGGIDWVELIAAADRVVAGFAGARFAGNPLLPHAAVFIVFTVRDGLITRMDDYRTRQEAIDAAGMTAPHTPVE
jgi:ketosteroid isomerase-like protein